MTPTPVSSSDDALVVDALALWSAPAPARDGVSFEVQGALALAPSWRLVLPPEQVEAEKTLASAEASVVLADSSLAAAGVRLDILVSQASGQPIPGVSFETRQPLDPAERELMALLAQGDRPPQEISYALGLDLPGGWAQASAEFQAFLQTVERFLRYYAWVESETDGVVFGSTLVNWLGDMRTAWADGVGSEQQARHERALASALAARTTMVRTVSVITAGAVALLPLLTSGAGAIVALPAVWKFINRVRAEMQRRPQLLKENFHGNRT